MAPRTIRLDPEDVKAIAAEVVRLLRVMEGQKLDAEFLASLPRERKAEDPTGEDAANQSGAKSSRAKGADMPTEEIAGLVGPRMGGVTQKKGRHMKNLLGMLGKYPPIAIPVYLILQDLVESSELGEVRLTAKSVAERMTYRCGYRPIRTSREVIRRVLEKFWEDGVFDFHTASQGTHVRPANRAGKPWLSILPNI